MMNRLIILLLILTAHFAFAQNFETKLQAAYDNFDNRKVDSLLTQAVSDYNTLSDQDKIAFHKFKAFRAFQIGEQDIVQNHFRELLVIDPVYTLDPITTSPKLLTLFDKTKIDYLEQQQQRLKALSEHKEFVETPWRSLLFPGWEQWHRGARIKGYSWMALGTITLAGTVQALIRTSTKHQAYLDENNPALLAKKYREYNDVYQSQYYWAYSMLTVWIASHIDAVFFTENKNIQIVMKSTDPHRISLGINIKL